MKTFKKKYIRKTNALPTLNDTNIKLCQNPTIFCKPQAQPSSTKAEQYQISHTDMNQPLPVLPIRRSDHPLDNAISDDDIVAIKSTLSSNLPTVSIPYQIIRLI